jgi:hypothetical protein
MIAKILTMLLGLTLILAVACGTAEAPEPTAASPTRANPTSAPTVVAGPTFTPTAAPTATALPPEVVSARDNITLVVNLEPTLVNLFFTGSGQISNSVHKDNLADSLTWQSGDDQRIVPTTATVGWEQLAPER